MIDLIDRRIGNDVISQRIKDGYINATAMCKAVGKLFADYRRLGSTEAFLQELSSDMGIPISQLVASFKGNSSDSQQGTWVHPDVAINLGQWCSPKFAVAVSKWVREWISKKAFEIDVSFYVSSNPLPWKPRFDIPFHKAVYLLKGKNVPEGSVALRKAPWLRQVYLDVYARLPVGVLDTILEINPLVISNEGDRPRRKYNIHQFIKEGAITSFEVLKSEYKAYMFSSLSSGAIWNEFQIAIDKYRPKNPLNKRIIVTLDDNDQPYLFPMEIELQSDIPNALVLNMSKYRKS